MRTPQLESKFGGTGFSQPDPPEQQLPESGAIAALVKLELRTADFSPQRRSEVDCCAVPDRIERGAHGWTGNRSEGARLFRLRLFSGGVSL
jgi:hypothetical protein